MLKAIPPTGHYAFKCSHKIICSSAYILPRSGIQQIPNGYEIGKSEVEIYRSFDILLFYCAEKRFYKITMRIDQTDASPGVDVGRQQVLEQG